MSDRPQLKLIAAMDIEQVIGADNRLPWHLPADWENFRAVTADHVFIMGRKSYFNDDALLSEKHNYVISRQSSLSLEANSTLVNSLDEALQLCAKEEAVFVLGGASIFELALPTADYLYLTIIHAIFRGDAHFPPIDWSSWTLRESRRYLKDEAHNYNFAMNIYERH